MLNRVPRTTSRCLCGRPGVARDFFPVRLDSLSQSTVWDRQTCQGKALGAALQHVLYAMSGAPRGFAKVSHSPLGARAKPELRCCPHHWHSTRQDPALGGGSPEPQLGKTSPPPSSAQLLCSLLPHLSSSSQPPAQGAHREHTVSACTRAHTTGLNQGSSATLTKSKLLVFV